MNQLTIRGFGKELERRIREVAREQGISLNQAVLRMLREAAGLEDGSSSCREVGASMDDLIGTWTDEEARELDDAVADFETIDEDMWR